MPADSHDLGWDHAASWTLGPRDWHRAAAGSEDSRLCSRGRWIAEGSSMAGPTAGWTEDRRPRKNIAGRCRPWTMFKMSRLRLL